MRRRSWSAGALRSHLEEAHRFGWIEWDAVGISLTESGMKRAIKIIRAERIWQEYLLSHAQIDRDLIDLDAEEIGKILPASLVSTLESRLRTKGQLPEFEGGVP